MPWKAAPGAGAVLGAIPEPTDEEEAGDAARDRALTIESRRVPPMLYNRVAVQVRADPVLALLDLHSVVVRERLALAPAVAHELRCWGFAQLDRGALLAPHRTLTQTVTGVVLRGDITSPVDGLFAESRHDDDVVAVFAGGSYAPQLAIVVSESLTPTQSSVILAARELGLAP